MIYYLEGKITTIALDFLVVDVNGVGYKVESNAPYKFGLVDTNVKVYTYMHVSENDQRLFGFINPAELQLFKKLLQVSGVGPKSALAVTSIYSPSQLAQAVDRGDSSMIKVKGLGTKTIAKIIIELKGKLDDITVNSNEVGTGVMETSETVSTNSSEFESALLNFGYKAKEIEEIAKDIDYDLPFAEQIRQALQLLRKI